MLEKRCVFFEILFSTILWGWVQNDSQGFPNRVDCWGTIGQNGQKLHENGKISIFGSKQLEGCGGDKPIFRLEWGAYPSPPILDEILTREGFDVLILIISVLLPMDLNQSSYDIPISWANSISGKIIIPKFFCKILSANQTASCFDQKHHLN